MNILIAAKEAYLKEQEEYKRKQESRLADQIFRMLGKEYMSQFVIEGNRADLKGTDYYLAAFDKISLTLVHKNIDGIVGYPIYSLATLWRAYEQAEEKLKRRKTFWGWLDSKIGLM